MLVRLAFSMFACFEPDVFIIDEALSVGDVFFQQKCARRLAEMKAAGMTMLFVSHDLAAVEALCDRVLVLHHGRAVHDGDKKTGIRLYYAYGGRGSGVRSVRARRGARAGAARGVVLVNVWLPRGAGENRSRPPVCAARRSLGADLAVAGRARRDRRRAGRDHRRLLRPAGDGPGGPVVAQGRWLQVLCGWRRRRRRGA